jgi:hypothetical protein
MSARKVIQTQRSPPASRKNSAQHLESVKKIPFECGSRDQSYTPSKQNKEIVVLRNNIESNLFTIISKEVSEEE